MLAILISWVAISIVFLSFGDFLVFLYNRLCKRNEHNETTDTFLLGMCGTLLPLSVSSLWLPSNHFVLLAYILFSIVYWIVRKQYFVSVVSNLRLRLKKRSLFQLIVAVVPVVSLMLVILWQVGVFDSLFYHQQNIRWNEEYAVVRGLGNLEHRFAFNSNYLLLSAIFSFRFLFAEAVYSLHVLVLVYILLWIIKEMVQSGYEVKRIMLLILFTVYIFTFGYTFTATSTDAIPNTISFYLIAKILLYPNRVKENILFYVLLPITLITFKVTIIPLVLVASYVLIAAYKKQEYKAISFSLAISFAIGIVWCIRNVIISGYLIFPLSAIDLFAVDWKIPISVAVEERDFILSCGIRIMKDIVSSLSNIQLSVSWITNAMLVGFSLISSFVAIYGLIRKKYLNKTIWLVYLILASIWTIWYMGGPDPRFVGGTLFAIIYFTLFVVLSTKDEKYCPGIGRTVLMLFTALMIYWPIGRSIRFYYLFDLNTPKEATRPLSDMLYRQYPYRELLRSTGFYRDEFLPYRMSDQVTIYISRSWETPAGRYVCFDSPFPCTVFTADDPTKYQDIGLIELRGRDLQEGFRPKKGF